MQSFIQSSKLCAVNDSNEEIRAIRNLNSANFEFNRIENEYCKSPPRFAKQDYWLSNTDFILNRQDIRQVRKKARRAPVVSSNGRLPRSCSSLRNTQMLNVITKETTAFPLNKKKINKKHHPYLPPKPRTVIIERWLPYDPPPKRKIIYQKSKAVNYKVPKNMIIIYDQPQPIIIRNFQRSGVFLTDPNVYTAIHGNTLLDSATLEYVAKLAGVHENIDVPTLANEYSKAY